MDPEIESVIDEMVEIYERYGAADYIGEPVSQMEHMSQAAQLAIRHGAEDAVVLAAFFHDIGHICGPVHEGQDMAGFGHATHEKVGADFLRSRGFPEKVAALVERHVQAKRYLAFKHPAYLHSLSEASRRTLEFQGSAMDAGEAGQFENDPLFEASILLRRWDEAAKVENMPLIDWETLRTKMRAVLSALK